MNEAAERSTDTAFDARKAFFDHAFALREENAKLVKGLFEAGLEAAWTTIGADAHHESAFGVTRTRRARVEKKNAAKYLPWPEFEEYLG